MIESATNTWVRKQQATTIHMLQKQKSELIYKKQNKQKTTNQNNNIVV